MGLLSRASTLDNAVTLPGLAFSDFINKHSLKICAVLEQKDSNYCVADSIGFDAFSIATATSTVDFWAGICREGGKIFSYSGDEKAPLLQLFSFNQKDSFQEFSVYKNHNNKILLSSGQLSDEAVKDFENISDKDHQNNILSLNPLLQKGSEVLLLKLDILDAAKNFYESEYNNQLLNFECFLKGLLNEIYNRFACRYNISDTTIKVNAHSIKTVIFTDKAYSVELIKNHLINNLKDILDNYAAQIQIDYSGTADSCDKIESFLQAE